MLAKGGPAFGCFARETSNEHYSRAIGLHHLLTMGVQATVIHLIAWSILLATWIYPSREIQGTDSLYIHSTNKLLAAFHWLCFDIVTMLSTSSFAKPTDWIICFRLTGGSTFIPPVLDWHL